MRKRFVKWFGCLASVVFLTLSCGGTKLTQTQVDEAYKGEPVSDILVIAITGNEDARRSFERQYVAHLESVGVEAISSEEAIPMPADLELKKEAIVDAIDRFGSDAVLITHLMGVGEEEIYTRGRQTYRDYYGFYYHHYNYVHDPGYSSTRTSLQLETNLFDVKTEKRIWSGQSDTWSRDSKEEIINDVIGVVIKDLQKNNLISPKTK